MRSVHACMASTFHLWLQISTLQSLDHRDSDPQLFEGRQRRHVLPSPLRELVLVRGQRRYCRDPGFWLDPGELLGTGERPTGGQAGGEDLDPSLRIPYFTHTQQPSLPRLPVDV